MFIPYNFGQVAARAFNQISIDTFLGVDLTNSSANVSFNQSPECVNMIRDVPGKVRKRMGYENLFSLNAPIYGCFSANLTDYIVHAGTKLYKLNFETNAFTEIYGTMNEKHSTSWEFENTLYITDGKKLVMYDGTSAKSVESVAYTPVCTIGLWPTGGGTPYESRNLLSPNYTEQYLGVAGATSYQLSFKPLDEALVKVSLLQANGVWAERVEGTHFSVDRASAVVRFVTAPGVSPIAGQDNVKITASCTVADNAKKINQCTFGIQYGVSGAMDRLFLSGNSEYKNHDWYSEYGKINYFPDTSYCILGQSDSAVMGYSIINSRLAAHKDGADAQRNVILRDGKLTDGKASFVITDVLQSEGAIAPRSFAYLANEPLFLTRSGIYAITAQDNTGERRSQCRSSFLNGGLLSEASLEKAFATAYNDMYWLCINSKIYILDGLQPVSSGNAMPYSTRQYVGFYCTNVPAQVMWKYKGRLMFGTENGEICGFFTQQDQPLSYADNNKPIYACWRTPDFSGKTEYRSKTFARLYLSLKSAAATGVSASALIGGLWQGLFGDFLQARHFSFSRLTFSKATFSPDLTPRTVGGKISIKKTDKSGFKLENNNIYEPFALNSIGIEFKENGYYKTT